MLNGPKQDIGAPQAAPGYDLNGNPLVPQPYRGPVLIKCEGDTFLPAKVAEAHRINQQHNRDNHQDCTPDTCFVMAEHKRLGL